ncbi:extracellular solute-binding protein [Azospirillum sp. A26]|uniref:extracellular solute-binding protein n=1 Tax=Azospirillum sp. A26 TaxID=3160607 RepID=UPI00366EA8BE
MTKTTLARRKFLGLSASVIAAPYILTSPARAAQRVVVRTPGGHRDEILSEVAYLPFQKATGIEIVPVSAPTSKLVAMTKMKQSEVDLVDNGPVSLTMLANAGALEPVPYDGFKRTNPNDIDMAHKWEFFVANSIYASVIGYNTAMFEGRKPPNSWAEFWDTGAYPGPRSLGSMDANVADLEMALLADGVPMDKLYPLDLERAFASLTRIRASVPKFWESGAMCAQMLASKEVAMTSIWSDRLIPLANQGAPVALTWNQCRIEQQVYGVMKYGSNPNGAKLFLDYVLSPEVQSKFAEKIAAIPANNKALDYVPAGLVDPSTGKSYMVQQGFYVNAEYWVNNIKTATNEWSKWTARR